MSSPIFYSDTFKEFCEKNNVNDSEGLKLILEEINKLSKEKQKILEERGKNDNINRFHNKC